jgi:hypothetical protein
MLRNVHALPVCYHQGANFLNFKLYVRNSTMIKLLWWLSFTVLKISIIVKIYFKCCIIFLVNICVFWMWIVRLVSSGIWQAEVRKMDNNLGNYTLHVPKKSKDYLILDFKLSSCSGCCMFSSGWFPEVWILYANVSEHSICSIFIPTRLWRWNRVFRNVGI